MNKRQQKYFALIDIIEMTHDWHFGGHYLDVPYYQFFFKLFAEGLAENTVILFFSDHGIRFGPLRETHSGEIEGRLPFMFIRLPDNTDQTYVEHMKRNQYHLTTHFDVHATLIHLLYNKPDLHLPYGRSLIGGVFNRNRDCTAAAIPQIYCPCFEDRPVLDYEVIHPNETIPEILSTINFYSENYRKECVEYKFEKIHRIYNRVNQRYQGKSDSKLYIIHVYVNPGMALFEMLVEGREGNTGFNVNIDFARINKYGNQSHCIDDKFIKNLCFCRDLL